MDAPEALRAFPHWGHARLGAALRRAAHPERSAQYAIY
jgi:hypothetical protein